MTRINKYNVDLNQFDRSFIMPYKQYKKAIKQYQRQFAKLSLELCSLYRYQIRSKPLLIYLSVPAFIARFTSLRLAFPVPRFYYSLLNKERSLVHRQACTSLPICIFIICMIYHRFTPHIWRAITDRTKGIVATTTTFTAVQYPEIP